jgi:hypothetical protein
VGKSSAPRSERITRYRLVIRSEPSSVPEVVRLRRLLKVLLRCLCFRCEEVTEIPAHETDTIG